MTFLYPSFLYALALVAVPIIIHFFNFRRFKNQEFTQVKFLKEATKVKKKFRRLRDLLVMILRMFAIACLVIAFAHPIPEGLETESDQVDLVSIYIDNSFSMGLEGNNGQLLSEAKLKAEQLTEGFGEQALFNLITNDPDDFSDDFVQKSVFIESLEEIQEVPRVQQAKDIYQQQRNSMIQRNGSRKVIWISDFQKNVFDFTQDFTDSLVEFYAIPIAANNIENIGIDSVWFEQGLFETGQGASMKVRISNYGEQTVENRSLYADVNGVQRAIQSIDLASGETKEVDLDFSIVDEGWNLLKVSVEDYPIEFDNDFYSGFYVDPSKDILSLYDEVSNQYLDGVFGTSEIFSFDQTPMAQTNTNRVDRYDLIIIDQVKSVASGTQDELTKAVLNGANLLIIPDDKGDQSGLLKQFGIELGELRTEQLEIKTLELEDPFFTDIFESVPSNTSYPKVFKHFEFRINTRTQTKALVNLNDGTPFLTQTEYGQGRVFVINGGLRKEWSTLFKNALFVPLMYKFASYSGAQMTIGQFIDEVPTEVIQTTEMNNRVLGLFNDQVATIPHQAVRQGVLNIFEDEITAQGFYELKEMESPDTVYAQLGYNFTRKESNLNFWSMNDLEEFGAQLGMKIIDSSSGYLGGTFKDINDKNRLWRYFIMAALCFLIFEIITIKLLLK